MIPTDIIIFFRGTIMKIKKHILKLSILAAVLACAIIAGSMFALANQNEAASSTDEKLNLMVKVPSEAVSAGDTFDVTVKISNSDAVAAKGVAGLEVTLHYPNTLSVDSVTIDENLANSSEEKYNTDNNRVKFACVKTSFSNEDGGYETLGNLFTVKFKATEDIEKPEYLFDSSSVECLIGDVTALEVLANTVYAGDLETLANEVLSKGFEFVISGNDANRLVVAIASTPPAGTDPKNAPNKTGDEITIDEKKATVVVKGDLDRDGVVSVFDATMINKFTDEDTLEKAAADLGAVDNAQQAVDYVVGNTTQITK